MIPVVRGMPTPELQKQAEKREVWLTGCVSVTGDAVDTGSWYCRTCKRIQEKGLLTEKQAIEAAKTCLRQQDWGKDYDEANPLPLFDAGDFWEVTFRHAEWKTQRPNTGTVRVNKKTGEARWMPGR